MYNVIKQCAICGESYTVHNPHQLTCSPKCKSALARKSAELRGEEFRKKKPKPCTKRNNSVTDIAVEARKAGMSYGQYVAMKGL